jgi:hypothetical protein
MRELAVAGMEVVLRPLALALSVEVEAADQ